MFAPSERGAFADMEQFRDRRRELRLQRSQENDQAIPAGAGSCSRSLMMAARQAPEEGRDAAMPGARRAPYKTTAQQLASTGAENNVNGYNPPRRSPRLQGSCNGRLGAPTRRAPAGANRSTTTAGGGFETSSEGRREFGKNLTNVDANRFNREKKAGSRFGIDRKLDDWKALPIGNTVPTPAAAGGASRFCAPPRPAVAAGGASDSTAAVQQLPTRPWPGNAIAITVDRAPEALALRADDFYTRLGVDHSAPDEEIANSYRAIVASLEKSMEDGAAEKLERAKEAYAVLSSPSKRKNYDIVLRRVEAAPNPQQCQDYLEEILGQLQQHEGAFLPRPNYMEIQTEINCKMRCILVDWLVEVHMKYKLRPHTLYLAVNLIDRYLSVKNTVRKRLQLVGVTSMFIAAKYEEIEPPLVQEFSYITDNAYTKDDILQMECHMLSTLAFQIMVPTVANYLDYNCQPGQVDEASHQVTRYLVELSILDLRMTRFLPSHLVAAAVLLTNELFCRQPAWPSYMEQKTGYAEDRLRECANELKATLDAQQRAIAGEDLRTPYSAQMQAVRRRYQQESHHAVARMVFKLS